MRERIENDSDLLKVDKKFIINTNESLYKNALARRELNKQTAEDKERLDYCFNKINSIEEKLDLMIKLLQGKS